jgi:hypothetical protein
MVSVGLGGVNAMMAYMRSPGEVKSTVAGVFGRAWSGFEGWGAEQAPSSIE